MCVFKPNFIRKSNVLFSRSFKVQVHPVLSGNFTRGIHEGNLIENKNGNQIFFFHMLPKLHCQSPYIARFLLIFYKILRGRPKFLVLENVAVASIFYEAQ